MKSRQLFMMFVVLIFSGCATSNYERQNNLMAITANKAKHHQKIKSIGYGSMSQYTKYSKAKQRLLAIRAARLNAYQNISNSIPSADNSQRYPNDKLTGIHIHSIKEINPGIYEAKAVMEISYKIL